MKWYEATKFAIIFRDKPDNQNGTKKFQPSKLLIR